MKRTLVFITGGIAVMLAGVFPVFQDGVAQNGRTQNSLNAPRNGDGSGYDSPLAVSMGEATGDPGRYDRKVILTTGKISSDVRTKTHKGKKYTVFKMRNSGGKPMLVYLKGKHAQLKTGDNLKITGRYYKKKSYLKIIKLKNVLKARKFEVLN